MTDLAERSDERSIGVAVKIVSRLAEAPEDLVLVSYGDEQWPADRLRAAVEQIASALPTEPGRPLQVAAVMRNRPWHIAVLAAVIGNEHCLVLLSPLEPATRSVEDVRQLRPDVVIAEHDDLIGELSEAASDVGAVTIALPRVGDASDVEVCGQWSGDDESSVGAEIAVLMLTSGTTGPAKRVPVRFADLTNAMNGAELHYVGRIIPGRRHQPSICPLPPVTISGLWALVTAMAGGAPLVLLDRFDPQPWSQLVASYQPRTAGLPPAALRMIIEAEIPADRLRSLTSIWCGAAPLDPALGAAFEAAYDIPVLQTYGATEFTGGLAGWSLADWKEWSGKKRGSVGRLHRGVAARVIDPDTGDEQPADSVGLLSFQTPHSVGVDEREWVTTSDLGRVDADGFLFVEGRADDIINRGGFKVSAGKLKSLLESHADVVEAAIVPLPDERLGNVPGALVVPRRGTAVTEADLDQLIRDELPPYYVPGVLRFADELPRNGAMKIIRPAVVQRLTR